MPLPTKCIVTDNNKTWCGRPLYKLKRDGWTYAFHRDTRHCGVCMRRLITAVMEEMEGRKML